LTTELLTIPETCAALRVGRSTVFELLRSGELRSIKIRGARRIPAAEVDALVTRLYSEAVSA
jgi:excisionase family DNA binding protein